MRIPKATKAQGRNLSFQFRIPQRCVTWPWFFHLFCFRVNSLSIQFVPRVSLVMAISQHYLTLFCLCLSTVLSYTIKSKPDVSKDANVSVTHEATRSLHARQMAFVRDCQPNQEQAILAATRRLSTVLLEGILASEQQTLETDEEMRSIFNNQWMQSRPNPDDNQVSVHFVLQRVWDEAYFTFLQAEEHRPVTAPGARIAPGGPGVRITCEDVQHRCRGMRPLYITHDRGIDREIYAGGNTIVIVSGWS